MHPCFRTLLPIPSYSLFILLGFLFGYLLARCRTRHYGIEARHIDNLFLLLSFTSLYGASVFGQLFYNPQNESFWTAFIFIIGGPKVLYGGVIFCAIAVILYSFIMRVSLRRLGDLFAPSLALGIMFGRIGCFLAGCCWGDVCSESNRVAAISSHIQVYQVQTLPIISGPNFPFAVTFPKDSYAYKQHINLGLLEQTASRSLPVHPVQIYETVFCLMLCIFVLVRSKNKNTQGILFFEFCIGYATVRFLLEFLRAGNSPVYWGMTVSQVISLIAIGISGLLYYFLKRDSLRAKFEI